MRKLFALLLIVAFVMSASFAFATPPAQDKGPPGWYQHDVTGAIKYFDNGHPGEPSQWTLITEDGPDSNCPTCISVGGFNITAGAIGYGAAGDIKFVPGGLAGGIGLGGGITGGAASGIVFDGAVAGDINVYAGGFAGNTTYVFDVPDTDISRGVGSSSHAEGYTGGNITVSVDPDQGLGIASGFVGGIAGQVTADGSTMNTHPNMNSNGFTGGIAGQGSIGAWGAYVSVTSGPDMEGWTLQYVGGHKFGILNPKNWACVPYDIDSFAAASAGADIEMYGNSYSESYAYRVVAEGVTTDGLGTNVGADTHVRTSKFSNTTASGLALAKACVGGGFIAAGGAAAMSVQFNENGGAMATAQGSYAGGGELGCNFDGNVVGGTYTAVTTVEGLNGSVMQAGANMAVSSRTFTGQGPVEPQ